MWFKVYGGVYDSYHGIYEFKDEEEAMDYAYALALEDYESYEGLHGILDWEQCYYDLLEMYGEEPTEEAVNEHYAETRESWITYYVKEVSGPNAEDEED